MKRDVDKSAHRPVAAAPRRKSILGVLLSLDAKSSAVKKASTHETLAAIGSANFSSRLFQELLVLGHALDEWRRSQHHTAPCYPNPPAPIPSQPTPPPPPPPTPPQPRTFQPHPPPPHHTNPTSHNTGHPTSSQARTSPTPAHQPNMTSHNQPHPTHSFPIPPHTAPHYHTNPTQPNAASPYRCPSTRRLPRRGRHENIPPCGRWPRAVSRAGRVYHTSGAPTGAHGLVDGPSGTCVACLGR